MQQNLCSHKEVMSLASYRKLDVTAQQQIKSDSERWCYSFSLILGSKILYSHIKSCIGYVKVEIKLCKETKGTIVKGTDEKREKAVGVCSIYDTF